MRGTICILVATVLTGCEAADPNRDLWGTWQWDERNPVTGEFRDEDRPSETTLTFFPPDRVASLWTRENEEPDADTLLFVRRGDTVFFPDPLFFPQPDEGELILGFLLLGDTLQYLEDPDCARFCLHHFRFLRNR